jgi:YbgC/YbaW family acyl-CoA thioester hydrolase
MELKMPRIKLIEKSAYSFSTNCTVRFDDINLGGHVDNAKLVVFLNEARIRYLKVFGSAGWDMGDMATGIIIADLTVNFRSEIFYGNELTIDCEIDEIEEKSFRMFFRVRNNGVISALAESGIVGVNIKEKKTGRIPEAFVEKILKYQESKK